jgi:hypothetical protein
MRLALALALICLCGACSSPRVQPVALPQEQKPMVWIRGDVKNPAIPWTEELTLARAIIAAEYKGLRDPHRIYITRQGETYHVNPRNLLRGREDPSLEPGDLIVIER